jgi:hypothetical protein
MAMAERGERRSVERFPASATATCPFVSPVLEDFGPVKIKNVSLEGVGLLLSHPVEQGEMLAVTLANPGKNFTKTVLVRVAYAQNAPGGCTVGGTFLIPLTYEELTALVL